MSKDVNACTGTSMTPPPTATTSASISTGGPNWGSSPRPSGPRTEPPTPARAACSAMTGSTIGTSAICDGRCRSSSASSAVLSPAAPPQTLSPVSDSTTRPRSAAIACATASAGLMLSCFRNASRKSQARAASSPASRSASSRSPSVTTAQAQPPSGMSSHGCMGKVEAEATPGRRSIARARSNQVFIGPAAVRNCSWWVMSGIFRHAIVGWSSPRRMGMSRRAASCPVSRMACGCVRCATRASQPSTMRCVRLAWWSRDSTIGVLGPTASRTSSCRRPSVSGLSSAAAAPCRAR